MLVPLLLASFILVPIENRTLMRSKEAVLRNELLMMRRALQQYRYDKQQAPQNITDLISEGYLHVIPVDPMTRSADTWTYIRERGIVDMHSGSDKKGVNGTVYSSW